MYWTFVPPRRKTVQMAAGMKGKGLLIANDISSDRVKALVKNIELCGITNAIVTNESPDRLAKKLAHFSTGYLWMLPVPAKECSEKTRMPQRAGQVQM